MIDNGVTWRKSSFSGGGGTGGGDCVEAALLGERFGLRDSKNPDAAALTLPHAAFAALLAEIKNA